MGARKKAKSRRTAGVRTKLDAATRTKLDADELRHAARLARSMLPRGADQMRGRDGRRRRMTDGIVVVEALLAVGAAEGTLKKSPWNEFTLRALAIVLADITDREAAARSVIAWRAVAKLSPKRQAALRGEIARELRENVERRNSRNASARRRRKFTS